MKKILGKYFDSEWSFAQLKVPEHKSLCAFSEDCSNLIVVTADGYYYLAEIPKKKGECTIKE